MKDLIESNNILNAEDLTGGTLSIPPLFSENVFCVTYFLDLHMYLDLLERHFNIVKLGFAEVCISFSFNAFIM